MLEVVDLPLIRGDIVLHASINLAVDAGQLALLAGDNGSGKTSLLRAVAGLVPADRARIHFDGQRGHPALQALRTNTRWLSHQSGLHRQTTVASALRLAAKLYGGDRSAVDLGRFGLAGYEDERVGSLSAGQRRRLSLATLQVAPRRLWLLDEPYANLDPAGATLVDRLLAAHCQSGGAIVIASHAETHDRIAADRVVAL